MCFYYLIFLFFVYVPAILDDILDVNGKISHNIVLPKVLKKQNWIAELNSIKTLFRLHGNLL